MAKGRPRKSADDVLTRSAELIGWALGGIEREIVETRSRLAALTERAAQLRKHAGSKGGQVAQAADAEPARKGRRRRMSAEGRKKIAEAAKRRWAKWRAENKNR